MLIKIITKIKQRIKEQKRIYPLEWFQERIVLPGNSDVFKQALNRPGIQIIAEIKKASPSAGIIARDFDAVAIAREYASADVAAISVLTESDFFQGSLDILKNVRQHVATPMLRKDFIIDPYQIYQSKYYGADGILLIAAIFSQSELVDFLQLAKSLGMNALIEIHDEFELEKALTTEAEIIGINNRDLKTFKVDVNTSLWLRQKIPADKIVVSESGIKNHSQVLALENAGVDAILIGETLMRADHKKECIQMLLCD
jgi:indole-3-glycerol phosphate synthase